MAYRTKQHKSTGKTPFYLVYERQVTLPLDLKIPHEIEKDSENPMINRLHQLITDLEDDHIEVQQKIE